MLILLGSVIPAACGPRQDRQASPSVITVFNAGSLAGPLRAALDTFAARHGMRVEQENAGSLETARKLTELGRIPDVIALADADVFPALLVPRFVERYTPFARNRMVLLYTGRSRFAAELSPGRWPDIVMRPGVETGRSDPNADPAGYRALLLFQLAERYYHRPGLAARLERAAPPRNVRPKSADLVALLQSGNLDYAWGYESVARSAGLRFLSLPAALDLGSQRPADSAWYATATVRVPGPSGAARRGVPQESLTVQGAPIVYAIAVPRHPPHGAVGERFITFLMSPAGQAILRAHYLDAMGAPSSTGARSDMRRGAEALSRRHRYS